MRFQFSVVILCLSILVPNVNGGYDGCLGDLSYKIGEACMSNDQCAPDGVCVQYSPKYPGVRICVRKPCISHTECNPGYFCRKSYDGPMIMYTFKGICCRGYNRL